MATKKDDIIQVSSLGKTWIFDLDGTVVKHNGYKIDGYDTLLDGAKDFFENIPTEDMIIFVTSRTDEYLDQTKQFLANNNIRYHSIISNAPYGERIIINDIKPSGLKTAIAINTTRDAFMTTKFQIEKDW